MSEVRSSVRVVPCNEKRFESFRRAFDDFRFVIVVVVAVPVVEGIAEAEDSAVEAVKEKRRYM